MAADDKFKCCGGYTHNDHTSTCATLDPPVPDAMQNAYNALAWIHFLAGQHYAGGAFDPEHMRGIANLAVAALTGDDIPDFDTAMEAARASAREGFAALNFAFDGTGGLVDASVNPDPEGGA